MSDDAFEQWWKGMAYELCSHKDAAVAAWDAAVASLTPRWSKEPPTVPGWYWLKEYDLPVRCVGVRRHTESGELVVDYMPVASMAGEWCGPLPVPREGTE